jgi:hypothetical protein
MNSQGSHGAAHVSLSFSPNVSLVSTVRRFVVQFYERILGDAELTSRVALATHELLENAVRYASGNETRIHIAVSPWSNGSAQLSITTWNRADSDALARVEEIFREMRQNSDPAQHYLELMQETAQRAVGSGLGLGRIRAEAEMELDYVVEDDWLRISARTALVRAEAA